jgi:hypothetical protein
MPLLDDAIAQALAAVQPPQPDPSVQVDPSTQAVFDTAGSAMAGIAGGAGAALDAFAPPAPQMGFQPPPAPAPPVGPAPPPVEEAYGPTFTAPTPPSTVAQADQQVGQAVADAAQSQSDADTLAFDANRARKNREAGTQAAYAERLGQLGADRQLATAHAHAQADAETAQHIQQLQDMAAREPNPSRYWDNMSGFGKAMWAIGMLAGAVNVSITPGAQNAALAVLRSEIDSDIKRQQERMGKELAALREKGGMMKDRHQRVLTDLSDEYTLGLTKLQALERAWMARDAVPGDLDAQAAKARAKALFDELKLPYISKWRDTRVQANEAANARAHDRSMQSVRLAHAKAMQDDEQAFTKEENFRKFQYDLAKSPVSVGVGAGSARNPIGKDGTPLYYELSNRADPSGAPQVVLADQSGKTAKDGVVMFKDKDEWKKANETIATADTLYNNLTRLRDDLKNEGSMYEAIVAGVMSPELSSLLQESGYAVAQLQNDRVTDKDFSSGVQQIVGFDPNGGWLQRGKFALNKDEVINNITRLIDQHHKKVQAGLQQFNNAAINGQNTQILYRPANLRPDKAAEETTADITGAGPIASATAPGPFRIGGAAPDSPGAIRKVGPVADVADYRQRSKEGAKDPNAVSLPKHDSQAVESVIAAGTGTGPKTVRAKAEKVLADLTKEAEGLNARIEAAHAASKDHWSDSTGQLPPDLQKAGQRLAEIAETSAIVKAVTADIEKRTKATLDKFEIFVEGASGFDAATLRQKAKYMGLGATEEVNEVLRKHGYGR